MEIRTFILTSDKFKGEVIFEFTNLVLSKYDTSFAELSDEQRIALVAKLPRQLAETNVLVEGSPYAKLTEITQEITFEMFWNKYDEKIGSSKLRTHKKWDKMSKGEQIKAFHFITKYFNNIPFGTRKKYAETYLNAELWNN